MTTKGGQRYDFYKLVARYTYLLERFSNGYGQNSYYCVKGKGSDQVVARLERLKLPQQQDKHPRAI